jgi:hypothetical protein
MGIGENLYGNRQETLTPIRKRLGNRSCEVTSEICPEDHLQSTAGGLDLSKKFGSGLNVKP